MSILTVLWQRTKIDWLNHYNIDLIDSGESDQMIKISGKVNLSNTYNRLSCNISFFIPGRTSTDKKIVEFFNILVIEEIDKIMMEM